MAISDIFIPALPIDFLGDFDSASGSAGAALISGRWATTAAILRSALLANESSSETQQAVREMDGPRDRDIAPHRSKTN